MLPMMVRTVLVGMACGPYKEFTDDGQAKPVGETITNHLFGDTCTLNDPEAAQQAQGEYERIITEMRTHLLELIPAHPHRLWIVRIHTYE